MMDNFKKSVMLTPDAIFDNLMGNMSLDDMQRVFRDYDKLSNISTKEIFDNGGKYSVVDIPNSLFEFMMNKLLISEGQIKLASHMHVFNKTMEVVLCLPISQYNKNIYEYRIILSNNKARLLNQINQIADELKLLSGIELGE